MDGSSPSANARRTLSSQQHALHGLASGTHAGSDGVSTGAAPVLKPVWTRAEDQLIMAGVRQIGPRWNVISQSMCVCRSAALCWPLRSPRALCRRCAQLGTRVEPF